MESSASAKLLSLDSALNTMLAQLSPLNNRETVSLFEADGRITAQDIISPINVPSFDNSAMDGYALRASEFEIGKTFSIAGKAFAGQPFEGSFPEGSCVRIMTGAKVPAGADVVIMQEQAEVNGDSVTFNAPIKAKQNIRFIGEDIAKDQVVFTAGTQLSTTQLPVIASLGIATVEVFKPLKVALFSTGDELQSVGLPLENGQIYDTNRFAIRLMLQKLGCEVIDLGIIRDNEDALRNAFIEADSKADVVISSGGVSVGDADYTTQILQELGEIGFWKLAIKPGKPFAFGQLKNSIFCGLPGNPVSAAVTFYQLVQPLIAKLMGHSSWSLPQSFKVKTCSKLKMRPGRLDFQRGMLSSDENGELTVATTGHQGSHIFSSFYEGNCFIVLEAERGTVEPGEYVTVQPFNRLLG